MTTTVQPNRTPHRLKLLSRTFARRLTVRKTVASLGKTRGDVTLCERSYQSGGGPRRETARVGGMGVDSRVE
jgi:hypothetical protein